tara:strand:- start:210 stop:407 length:198 start_codon:yes stop_codon:yes gene_type:complete
LQEFQFDGSAKPLKKPTRNVKKAKERIRDLQLLIRVDVKEFSVGILIKFKNKLLHVKRGAVKKKF